MNGAPDITTRIGNKKHLKLVTTPEQAAAMIHPSDTVGMSGFTPTGYPKAVPLALAKRIEKEHFKIQVFTGASVGDELDGALVRAGGISRRYPYQSNNDLRQQINTGNIAYVDMHLSVMPQQLRSGFFGKMAFAIVEAAALTPDGDIIPTTSLGATPTMVSQANKVIVEINVTKPLELAGMHDIYEPLNPPYRRPIPIARAGDRIGLPYIKCGWDKIAAIVPCDIPDTGKALGAIDNDAKAMSKHIIKFLQEEVRKGALPYNLLPLQSGVGSVANAVITGLQHSVFTDLSVYTEVLQDGMLDLIDAGKIDKISTTAISTSPEGTKRFFANLPAYKDKIVLRPQEISNNPEVIRRLGVISINTAIEADIYGNVNSSHVCGTKIMNGIGGAGDFARASYLSIFCTPSIAKKGAISSIVPMCSHIDHTEHDVDVICTEQGLADLRGLSPIERARLIIRSCANPKYREQLTDYLNRSLEATNLAHIPHILKDALSWHQRFIDTGTMEEKSPNI